MLEALCTRHSTDDGIIENGDVVVLALTGQPWGTDERKLFDIVSWKDDRGFMPKLLARRTAGEPWPTIAYPYAKHEGGKLTDLSTRRLDIWKRSWLNLKGIMGIR